MGARELLQNPSVLDLCCGDVLLPAVPTTDAGAAETGLASRLLGGGTLVSAASRAIARAAVASPIRSAALNTTLRCLSGAAAAHDAPASDAGCPPTLGTLAETLAVGSCVVARWAREASVNQSQLQAVARALEGCLQLAQKLPRPPQRQAPAIDGVVGALIGTAEKQNRDLQGVFCGFLGDVVARIKAVPRGGLLMLPAGWLRGGGAQPDDGGHCVLLVLVRNLSNDNFSLAVVNTGEGLQYHPVQPLGRAPCPEHPARQTPLILTDIPSGSVTTSCFWYLVYRQMVLPEPGNGPGAFYGVLLPGLNRRPLCESTAAEPEGWASFEPVPCTGDTAFVVCMQRAVQFCLRATGLSAERAAWGAVHFRMDVMCAIADALGSGDDAAVSVSELAIVRLGAETLARAAADHAAAFGAQGREADLGKARALVERLRMAAARCEVADRGARSAQPPVSLVGAATSALPAEVLRFQNFDRLLAQDVEHLKGSVDPQHVSVPVPMTELPASIRTPQDAAACCRFAANLLALLANQQEHLTQSAVARFALVVRLVVHLLPMPMPVDDAQKATRCFWMQAMTPETKTELARHLHIIVRHFAAVCFSLRANRETDCARIIVVAAAAAIMDALFRRPVGEVYGGALPAMHYNGEAAGPTAPFGLDPGAFREASESLLLVLPEYQALRALVLDYFDSVRRRVDDEHVVLRFDDAMSCGAGDVALMEQIGLSMGVEGANREAPLLLTGERPELLEMFPEIGYFRDVIFLWKLLLLPIDVAPEPRACQAREMALDWRWDAKASKFVVKGFGMSLSAKVEKPSYGTSLVNGVLSWFGRYRPESKCLSRASATVLAGSEVRTEDDVLFLEHLPTFNGALGLADSELLLSYLTAPYIRVPLLLGFFTDRHRITLLREPSLRAVLDAALFEPGAWLSREVAAAPLPKTVPAADRAHLSTPAGLLMNEIVKAPRVVVEAALSMLRVAVEKDVGRPDGANEGLILYLVRLAVRIDSYLDLVIRHARRGAYSAGAPAVRGLPVVAAGDKEAGQWLEQLESARARLQRELRSDVLRMLLRWIRWCGAKAERGGLLAACRAHAHAALLYRSVAVEDMDMGEMVAFLTSQIFLQQNYRWLEDPCRAVGSGTGAAEDSDSGGSVLGVGEVELYGVFEAKRGRLAERLRAGAGRVLEQVERRVTSASSTGDGAAAWCECPRNPGDFVPVVEVPLEDWYAGRAGESFRDWLLRTTQGPPGHSRLVSLNLGQYGMKREGLELLPMWASLSEEYAEAYGRLDAHCIQAEVAAQRVTKDLVGHRHTLQRWAADARGLDADAEGAARLRGRAYRAGDLSAEDRWVAEVLEPIRTDVAALASTEWRWSGRASGGDVWLAGLAEFKGKGDQPVQYLKEVRVHRSPPFVEVYNVVEHGRHFHRCLVFSSDTAWSFHAPLEGEVLLRSASSWTLAAGRADSVAEPAPSVVVSRQVSDVLGRQVHVSRRFLRGLLPDALVERYRFWRCGAAGAEQAIVGDEAAAQAAPTRLYVTLQRDDLSGGIAAVVQRKALRPSGRGEPPACWDVDGASRAQTLVNLHGGAPGMANLLARLESLSHVLVWTDGEGVAVVELPRLRLSFSREAGRLLCDQHRGYWLLERECPAMVGSLVAQWGGGTVLLENTAGDILVVVSALAEPIRCSGTGLVDAHLPNRLLLRRGEAAWVSNLSDGSRHYYYPLHASGTFAFAPTLSASLYLLLCRFFTWSFAEIAAMADSISEVTTSEEKQLWDRIHLVAASTHHPDAVACCLRLADATAPFGGATACVLRWDARKLLLEYVRKRRLVSANCALPLPQELRLIDNLLLEGEEQEAASPSRWARLRGQGAAPPKELGQELSVRRGLLKALVEAETSKSGGGAPRTVALQLGPYVGDSGFDRVADRTYANEVGFFERISATFQDVAYNRPEKQSMSGVDALAFLDELFVGGGIDGLSAPFPLLYELLTGTLVLQPVGGDDSATAAGMLLRVAARDGQKNAGHAVLRALESNAAARSQMPKLGSRELTWSFGVGALKFDRHSTTKLLEAAGKKLVSLEASGAALQAPRSFRPLPPAPGVLEVSPGDARDPRYRAPPLTPDARCASRALDAARAREFGTRPLAAIADKYVAADAGRGDGAGGSGTAALRACLEQLASSAPSLCAKQQVRRLLEDLQAVPKGGRDTLSSSAFRRGRLAEELASALRQQRDADVAAASVAIHSLVERANKGDVGSWLRREGGALVRVTFVALVKALMSSEPRATDALLEVNPALSREDVAGLLQETAAVLCHTSRMCQISRVQQALDDLEHEQAGGAGDVAVALRAQAAAAQLAASRHFVRFESGAKASGGRNLQSMLPFSFSGGGSQSAPSGPATYDPRLLAFEFLLNILLRRSQVDLIDLFMARAKEGKSVCHQMIMGEGKTTVIVPLLTLLLGDGERLVCACMPAALLHMSRTILSERFSSPVLPRPTLTFNFNRHSPTTEALLVKLRAAQACGAAVVAAPTALKSALLRQVELLLELVELRRIRRRPGSHEGTWLRVRSWLVGGDDLDKGQKAQEATWTKESRVTQDILRLFHGGMMLLDEVDMLLDPMRSELNWPLGKKVPLDLAGAVGRTPSKQYLGLRFKLPFHLLDAIFVASTGCSETTGHAHAHDAQKALGALAEVVKIGKREHKLQSTPHLLVLSMEFYTQEMLPLLADWAAVFLGEYIDGALGDADLKRLLRMPEPDAKTRQQLRNAPSFVMQLLNLALSWLHSMLPYVLGKVHRVSYGLLTGAELEKAHQQIGTPLSRKLLVVPFVGKDAPSAASEFSHPDVTIGLSILAYRLHGMREGDVKMLLRVLLDEMRAESSMPYHRRKASLMYVSMVTGAGGTVRGFTEDGRWVDDLTDDEQRKRKEANSKISTAGLAGDAAQTEDRRRNLWPLELLDINDPEQMSILHELLRHSAAGVQHYLEQHAFVSGTLERNDAQLTASGQELAGPQLFGQCLGFSGTPNDLLPRPMGACIYAKGDDGKVLTALSNTDVVSVAELEAWTPVGLLDIIADARSEDGKRPRYHALIDSGALITGMTNLQVAEYLLKRGLEGFEGVLFLNERDERVVLERDGLRVVELPQCGIAVDRRFTFYDHVHTTGMDVQQPLVCVAVLTLSKDMTFRDYAQGAYRMRGIGRGQGIELILTPEVHALMKKVVGAGAAGSDEGGRSRLPSAGWRKNPKGQQKTLVDVIAWLVLNGARAEERKRLVLAQQDLYNLWRCAASQCLGGMPAAEKFGEWVDHPRTHGALGELRSRVDYGLPVSLPGEGGEAFAQRLRREAGEGIGRGKPGEAVWASEAARDEARATSEVILANLPVAPPQRSVSSVGDEPGAGLFGEQVREQEQEEEQEQEQQHEHEVQMEEEVEKVAEAPKERKYSREDEAPRPWQLKGLLHAPGQGEYQLPFYPLAEFSVNHGIFGESCEPLAGLPGYVLVSDNYYRRAWRLTAARRVRNAMCFLEWVPSADQLRRLTVQGAPGGEQQARLAEVFQSYSGDGSKEAHAHEVRNLFRSLDLDIEGDLVSARFAKGKVTWAQIQEEVSTQALCRMQEGRFFVQLSLQEAEHLRASLHCMRLGTTWSPKCGLAFRCIANKECGLNDSLIDAWGPVLTSAESGYQLEVAEQMYRFLNSAHDFQSRELSILLRSLQLTRVEHRLPWWSDVRSCRRRPQRAWQQLAVAKVFVQASEFDDLPTKALLSRVRWVLASQRIWPVDAFRMFDKSGTGRLCQEDLRAGLEQLGLRRAGSSQAVWLQQVDALFRLLDRDGRQAILLEQFRAAMELDVRDWSAQEPAKRSGEGKRRKTSSPFFAFAADAAEDAGEGQPSEPRPRRRALSLCACASRSGVTEPQPRRQVSPAPKGAGAQGSEPAPRPPEAKPPFRASAVRLSPEMCVRLDSGRFKLKWQAHGAFQRVWATQGAPGESPLSVWAPVELIPTGRFQGLKRGSNAAKERIPLGCYGCPFYGAPTAVQLLEVTDVDHTGVLAKRSTEALRAFVDAFFPHPVRYRKLWHQVGASPVHIWEPMPPAPEFVALGVVATRGDEGPLLTEVRCVPRPWVERSQECRVIWAGAGAGGVRVHFWAGVGTEGADALLHVTAGAAAEVAPDALSMGTGTFYVSPPNL